MKKHLTLLIALIMIVTVLAGCAAPAAEEPAAAEPVAEEPVAAEDEPAAPAKDTLYFMANINAETLDPAIGKIGDHTVWHALMDTIVNYGPEGEVIPNLAESWSLADDGMSYILKLREDVKFHDGSPFSADDVIFTFDTVMLIPMYAQFGLTFTAWEKVDDYTVKFTPAVPYAKVLETLALMSFVIPQETYNAETFGDNPIGTGPYKFVSREADGSITLSANEEYFGGVPTFKNAVIKPPVDPSTAVVALENGEVDIILNVPASQVPIIEDNADLVMVQVTGWTTYSMVQMGPVLKEDLNLRKAIYHAIDREKLVILANEGIGEPTTDVHNTKLLGDLAGTVDYVGYDEALAQDYLAQSNYTPDQVLMITATQVEAAMAQAVQADLKKIGIETEIEQLDINGWSTKILNGEAEIVFVQFGGVSGALEGFLQTFSQTYPYFGKDMASTPEYEDLIGQMMVETDAAARKELVKQALQILYDSGQFVALYDSVLNHAHSKTVANIAPISAATSKYYIKDYTPAQ